MKKNLFALLGATAYTIFCTAPSFSTCTGEKSLCEQIHSNFQQTKNRGDCQNCLFTCENAKQACKKDEPDLQKVSLLKMECKNGSRDHR